MDGPFLDMEATDYPWGFPGRPRRTTLKTDTPIPPETTKATGWFSRQNAGFRRLFVSLCNSSGWPLALAEKVAYDLLQRLHIACASEEVGWGIWQSDGGFIVVFDVLIAGYGMVEMLCDLWKRAPRVASARSNHGHKYRWIDFEAFRNGMLMQCKGLRHISGKETPLWAEDAELARLGHWAVTREGPPPGILRARLCPFINAYIRAFDLWHDPDVLADAVWLANRWVPGSKPHLQCTGMAGVVNRGDSVVFFEHRQLGSLSKSGAGGNRCIKFCCEVSASGVTRYQQNCSLTGACKLTDMLVVGDFKDPVGLKGGRLCPDEFPEWDDVPVIWALLGKVPGSLTSGQTYMSREDEDKLRTERVKRWRWDKSVNVNVDHGRFPEFSSEQDAILDDMLTRFRLDYRTTSNDEKLQRVYRDHFLKRIVEHFSGRPAFPSVELAPVDPGWLETEAPHTGRLRPFREHMLGDKDKRHILLVSGPCGSGKTQFSISFILDCVRKGRTVLYISPRRIQLNDVYRQLGEALDPGDIWHYEHDKGKATGQKVFLSTIHSLHKAPQMYHEAVIYDEVLTCELGDFRSNLVNRAAVDPTLCFFLNQARVILLMDADLNPWIMLSCAYFIRIERLHSISMGGRFEANRVPTVVHRVVSSWDPVKDQKRLLFCHKNRGDWLLELVEQLAAGKRVAATFSNRAEIAGVRGIVEARVATDVRFRRDLRVVEITSNDRPPRDQSLKQYLEEKQPDLLLYTSVIGVGNSIDAMFFEGKPYWGCVFALFNGTHFTALNCRQILERVRNFPQAHICLPSEGFQTLLSTPLSEVFENRFIAMTWKEGAKQVHEALKKKSVVQELDQLERMFPSDIPVSHVSVPSLLLPRFAGIWRHLFLWLCVSNGYEVFLAWPNDKGKWTTQHEIDYKKYILESLVKKLVDKHTEKDGVKEIKQLYVTCGFEMEPVPALTCLLTAPKLSDQLRFLRVVELIVGGREDLIPFISVMNETTAVLDQRETFVEESVSYRSALTHLAYVVCGFPWTDHPLAVMIGEPKDVRPDHAADLVKMTQIEGFDDRAFPEQLEWWFKDLLAVEDAQDFRRALTVFQRFPFPDIRQHDRDGVLQEAAAWRNREMLARLAPMDLVGSILEEISELRDDLNDLGFDANTLVSKEMASDTQQARKLKRKLEKLEASLRPDSEEGSEGPPGDEGMDDTTQ